MSFHRKPKKINPDELDPSVYYYDEVYDDMKDEEKNNQKQSSSSSIEKQLPKYTAGLQESAELRKSEKELRKFKKYAKDRIENQHDLLDDEVFITSSYKKKLEEIKRLEEDHTNKLKLEKDKSLNFNLKTEQPGFSVKKQINEEYVDKQTITSTTSTQIKLSSQDKQQDLENTSTPHKHLKTLQDRRDYLCKVLEKRTVGEKYHEAVRRYIERKSRGLCVSKPNLMPIQ